MFLVSFSALLCILCASMSTTLDNCLNIALYLTISFCRFHSVHVFDKSLQKHNCALIGIHHLFFSYHKSCFLLIFFSGDYVSHRFDFFLIFVLKLLQRRQSKVLESQHIKNLQHGGKLTITVDELAKG